MHDYVAFERYRPIVDEWESFAEALSRPLPSCIWTNTLRTTPEKLAKLLSADGLDLEPLSWYRGGFLFPHGFKPGRHWAYLAGLYHVQEAVSMLPILFLDPQPGERILDLCAAPGNKTAQLAVKMANRGTVVANDKNYSRMRPVRHTLDRLGLVNVSITTGDGANYPKKAGLFDKVVVDAPCSGEGTSRKDPLVLTRVGPKLARKKQGLQLALMRKAVQHCKSGGRIVYATCTYAPEENEMVVDAILREYGPDLVRVIPARIHGFMASEGLTTWNDRQFHPSLRRTMRIWPHQNDTGGFYIAVLEKRGSNSAELVMGAEAEGSNPGARVNNRLLLTEAFGDAPGTEVVLELLVERFGIPPERFETYVPFKRSRGRLYLVAQDHQPPLHPAPDGAGLLFMKTRIKYPKLSTAAALAFGAAATRNFIDLNRQQVQAYIDRRDFRVSVDQSRSCTGMGYILVRYQGYGLGVGLIHLDESNTGGLVRSMFPKAWSPKAKFGTDPFNPAIRPPESQGPASEGLVGDDNGRHIG